MSGVSAKCLIEVPGLSEFTIRSEMFETLSESVCSCETEFSYYQMSAISSAENVDKVIFGTLQPEQIIRLASGMKERCYRRSFALFEDGMKDITDEDRPQLSVIARTIFDFEQALMRGADRDELGRWKMTKALENLSGNPNCESNEIFICRHEHSNTFGETISTYPSETDMEYVKEHPEDFAYVEIYFVEI